MVYKIFAKVGSIFITFAWLYWVFSFFTTSIGLNLSALFEAVLIIFTLIFVVIPLYYFGFKK